MEQSKKIKELRESTGMNRKEFCDYFQIPYRTVTEWERDNRHAPEYVVRLLEYYIRMEKMVNMKENEGYEKEEKTKEMGMEILFHDVKIHMKPREVLFYREKCGCFSTFTIPEEFKDSVNQFYDLYVENESVVVVLAARKGYDIAIVFDEQEGKMRTWHYNK